MEFGACVCVCVLGRSNGFREAERSVFPLLSLDTTQKESLALGLHPPGRTAGLPLPGALPLPPQAAWPPCGTSALEVPAWLCRRSGAGRQHLGLRGPLSRRPPGGGHGRCRLLPEARRGMPAAGREPRRADPGQGSRVCLESLRGFSRVWSFATLFRKMSERKMTSERQAAGLPFDLGKAQVDQNNSLCVVLLAPLKDLEVNCFPAPGCLCLVVVRASLLSLSFGFNIIAVSSETSHPARLCISGCSFPMFFKQRATPQEKTADILSRGKEGSDRIKSVLHR